MLQRLFQILTVPLWWPWWLLRALLLRRSRRDTLVLKLKGSLPDIPAVPSPVRRMLGARMLPDLPSALRALQLAQADPEVKRVVVQLEELSVRLGRAEELRAALAEFGRVPGKEVVAYAEQLELSSYWVALGASRIVMPPTGQLNLTGIGLSFTLLRGLLDRAGVKAELQAQGRYKSMREMFTEKKISEANREALESLVESLVSALTERIAAAREMAAETVSPVLDQGPFTVCEAHEKKLIDAPAYASELDSELALDKRGQSPRGYLQRVRYRRLWPLRPQRLGLLAISGSIRHGEGRAGASGNRSVGNKDVEHAVRRALRDKRLRGVLVRIDSPGGSALASDLMWHALGRLAKAKPVVVSMGDMAASGGYYAAGIPNAEIWANPTTLTGSIGVVGGKLCVAELLSKLGISQELLASNARSHFYNPTRPWTREDLEKLERDMHWLYEDFVGKMAKARSMPHEEMHAVAQGRVWTGTQARERRLVDQLGGLRPALASLCKKAGVSELELGLVALGRKRSWRGGDDSAPNELLGRSAWGPSLLAQLSKLLGEEAAASVAQRLDLQGERLLLLCATPHMQ